VELRVVERTGDVRVSVRTGDSRLNTSLREDLPQLVSQLSERGYRAETWHPAAVQGAADGRGLRAENPEPARDGGTFGGHTGRGGSDTAGRDGNGGRRQQEQDQPEWLDALERSLGRGHVPPRSILR
jgi:hypothetical protein